MKIAVTGGTGFVGRYIIKKLTDAGHHVRGWHRPTSSLAGLHNLKNMEWVSGQLGNVKDAEALVADCDAVVHSALDRPGSGFRGAEGHLPDFVQTNVVGTLQLIEAAKAAGVQQFVFISTCAVHEEILEDRPLDEAHPLWPRTHYGAHKAAIEKFVHSYGLGEGYPICALRPTGVYGEASPIQNSKWYDLVSAVVRGETVNCTRGGKEVHAADVAKAVEILLGAENIAGQAYSCYDRYTSEFEVATLAKEISGSHAEIKGGPKQPKHQIETGKIRSLGMEFGGAELLRQTVASLVQSVS